MEFTDYMRQRLVPNGYRVIKQTTDDLFLRSPEDDMIWVMYLNAVIEPEHIRRAFDFHGYMLFVVNEKLIPDEIESREATPMWLRTLHGLYMGRIYVWNGRGVYGLHFDYDAGEISESSFLQFDALLLVETGTWLRGWPGTYRLARFWDKAWWTDVDWTKDAGYQTRDRRQRQQEQERTREWEQQHGNPFRGRPPQQEQAKRDFLSELLKCGTLNKARLQYRALAKEFHPDLTGRDTNAEMQQVNAAWEKAQRMMV